MYVCMFVIMDLPFRVLRGRAFCGWTNPPKDPSDRLWPRYKEVRPVQVVPKVLRTLFWTLGSRSPARYKGELPIQVVLDRLYLADPRSKIAADFCRRILPKFQDKGPQQSWILESFRHNLYRLYWATAASVHPRSKLDVLVATALARFHL